MYLALHVVCVLAVAVVVVVVYMVGEIAVGKLRVVPNKPDMVEHLGVDFHEMITNLAAFFFHATSNDWRNEASILLPTWAWPKHCSLNS